MVPVSYHVRSLFRRRWATALTVFAIACSVGVLVVMLGLAHGFRESLQHTGRTDNVVVLRKGATSEGESGLDREQAQILAGMPGVARATDDTPLAGAEVYAAVSLDKVGGGTSNIPFRGVTPVGVRVQSTAALGAGRWFKPGTREIVAGRGLVDRVEGCRLGGAIRFSGEEWSIVGIIDAPKQAWNSELWTDAEVLIQVLDRRGFNTMVLRLADGTTAADIARRVEKDPRLQSKVMAQTDYYASQVGLLGQTMQFVALFLSIIMAVGSGFGATNTLLASLQGRRREIGTLLSIGYRPWHVYLGFLLEATLLGAMGGAVGVVLPLPFLAVFGSSTGTVNWQTFTEQAFSIEYSPAIVVMALVFGSFVGLVGGTLPAWRASRLAPTEALRAH